MMESQRNGISLFSYGGLIIKLLEHIGFNLEEEEYIRKSTRIRNYALGKCR